MLVMVAWTASAWAQILPVPATVVVSTPPFDPTNDFGITSWSLTAPGGGGNWAGYTGTSVGGLLAQDLGPGALFPGWAPCKPDCTTSFKQIIQVDYATYQSALLVADQSGATSSATLANIETDAGQETNLLPLQRDMLDAQLNTISAINQLTQSVNALIKVEVAAHVTELNARAQERVNSISDWDAGVPLP